MSHSSGVDFLHGALPGFGAIDASAESYHGPVPGVHHSLCETWWFTAHVPERNQSIYFYISTRPNLQMCSAGAWIWTDFPEHPLLLDHQNYHNWLPLPEFDGNTIRVAEVGLTFEVLRPLERVRVTYRPPNQNVSAEIESIGILPPLMRANGKHFEQACRAEGWIKIGSDTVKVNSPAFRDRSWGEPRPEASLVHPPLTWLAGASEADGLAFNLSGVDDERGAEWAGVYTQPVKSGLFDGWILRDGAFRKISHMSKHTTRDPARRMCPSVIRAELLDDRGESHLLTVRLRNGFAAEIWPNIYAFFAMTEWELDGVKAIGELNDFMWADYAKRFWR